MPPNHLNQPMQPYQGPPGTMPPTPAFSTRSAKSRSGLLIAILVVFILLFLGATGFGIWAYGSQQDYKNNADQKATTAAQAAVKQEDIKKDAEFAEKEKFPLKNYKGPSAYGSVVVSYPKTWSAYVIESDRANPPINGYFHPNFVPDVQGTSAFALRIQVVNQAFAQVMKQFDGKAKAGQVKISAFSAKNVSSVTGARVDGAINQGQTDSMVLLPIRDKTLEISTQSKEFLNDFNNTILPSLKFVP